MYRCECDLFQDYLGIQHDSMSSTHSIVRGVPQGSSLGPLLFRIHSRDLPSVIELIGLTYADDTIIIFNVNASSEASSNKHNMNSNINETKEH